eukprot:1347511-Prymnesium_polylepis.1
MIWARPLCLGAVGVKFASTGDAALKAEVKAWVVALLDDESEKVRRYAANAIPKLVANEAAGDAESEERLLQALERSGGERERKKVAAALGKIGGAATLSALERSTGRE